MNTIRKLGLAAALVGLCAAPAMAGEGENGGGENGGEYDFLCSPGFFKNHPEVWMDLVGDDFDSLMAGLNATGKTTAKPGALKQEIAAYLNAFWVIDGAELPCEDGDPVE
jgi:hypothetical protein